MDIQPVYNRPGNLLRKMQLMQEIIDDMQRMQHYYCPIFDSDPWMADRIQEAEEHLAALKEAFEKETEGLS